MKTLYSRYLSADQMSNILKKPPLDEVILGEGAKAKIRQVFGKDLSVREVVDEIIKNVRQDGDKAVLRYNKVIDGADLTVEELTVSQTEIDLAMEKIDKETLAALETAVQNVRRFHAEQLPKSWFTEREHGALLGQKCTPLDSVGIYVPGGTAIYPSSVIMNAVPALVAGVKDIVMVSPPAQDGSMSDAVLAAAKLSGVTKIYKVGGAQAIAALAFGTPTIPKVDKITGPGNIFVTLAKKAVYGNCDIDMLAGPSEILIVADDSADVSYVAADMLSQAEHDVLAASILVTSSDRLAKKVSEEILRQLENLPRREIISKSLEENGLIIVTQTIVEAMEIANKWAPEHLEILTADPFSLLPYVKHAGAVFMGPYSPEPLGDYLAGPNHVLPTGGTAKFYSVLNVETFMKKTSIIAYTPKALAEVSDKIIKLAKVEGLEAHANSVRIRGGL